MFVVPTSKVILFNSVPKASASELPAPSLISKRKTPTLFEVEVIVAAW
jgi:hypothetical protein